YADGLRATTALIEALKRPELQRSAAIAPLKWNRMVGRDDAMFRRSHALTRCAIAALAAERYRRANGRWPESLAELVTAGLLRAVPGDSFDGQPLRLKPT